MIARSTTRRWLALGALLAALASGAWGCGDGADPQPPDSMPETPASERGGPPEPPARELGARHGVSVREIALRGASGRRVRGLLATPPGSARGAAPSSCVIYQGGLGFALSDAASAWDPLVGAGYSVLTIEPRFHGEPGSVGGPHGDGDGTGEGPAAEPSLYEAIRDPELVAAMMRGTVRDLRRAIDLLLESGRCAPGGVGYVGLSLGGMLGALLAGADERVSAAALLVAGGDWEALLEGTDELLPGIEDDPARFEAALETLRPVDPARWVGRIAPRPVLLANGRDDRIVVPEAARALHRAATPPKRIIWYPGGHFLFHAPASERVLGATLELLGRGLGR